MSKRDDMAIFGNRVREIRKRLSLSQRECAKSLEISGSFLSEIEAGKVKPGYEFFKNIRSKYNVNFDYLFTGEGEPFRTETPESDPEVVFDFGIDNPLIKEMLRYFRKSPFLRFAMLQHYRVLVFEKLDLIEHEIKQTLEKEKKMGRKELTEA
ncbi:MAG: helix-turn-helix transcriptional regulator [bacterium]|nr:helix-turn-helix transcriptional regulator [bacterium]